MSQAPTVIPPDAVYLVWDSRDKRVAYETTYRHRIRARRWADRADLAWGAVRYLPGIQTDHFPPKQATYLEPPFGLDNFPGVRRALFGA